MTYAVFQYDSGRGANDLIQTLSLLLLLQPNTLKGFDVAFGNLNTRILSNNTVPTLVGYLSCKESKIYTVSIVKFPIELITDERLIAFGNDYLGCVTARVKKADLLQRVKAMQLLERNERIKDRLTDQVDPQSDFLKSYVGLSDDELTELKTIELARSHALMVWIDEREKRLKKGVERYRNLLRRGF
jgi:hypothetical protein